MTAGEWCDRWQRFRADLGDVPAKELEQAWIDHAAKHSIPLRMPPARAPKRPGRPPKTQQ